MTTLNEELLIRIAADTAALKTGMEDAKKQVGGVGDEATKSGKKVDSANKSMLQSAQAVKRTYMSIIGIFTLVGAGIAAVTRPILGADDAIRDLQGSLLLANKSFVGTSSAVKLSADALGITYADAADRAAVAVRRYGQSSAGAIASVRVGSKLAALGFGSLEQAQQAALQVADAFNMDLQATGTALQNTLAKGAVMAKADLGDLSGALVQLAPQAQALNVDMGALVSVIGAMRQNGAPLPEVVAALSEAMSAALKPTQEQAAALQNLGIGAQSFAGTGIVGVMERLGQAAAVGDERFKALAESNSALSQSLIGLNGALPNFSASLTEISTAGTTVAAAIDQSRSSLDSLTEVLPRIANSLSTLVAPLEKLIELWQQVSTFRAQALAASNNVPGFDNSMIGGFATGGFVGGTGSGDTVPAMLTPGEFVIRKKVAEKMRPFLSSLNASNGDLMSLWNTALSNTMLKGTRIKLLDAIGIQHPQRGLAGTSFNASYGASGEKVSMLASALLGEFSKIKLNSGGPVRKMAGGGSVGPRISRSTTINGGVNISFPNANVSPAFVRRQIVPAIERIGQRGQSRIARSRR